MWDEDPKVVESSYRLLKWSVVVGLIGGFIIALWTGEWTFYGYCLAALGVWVAALAMYVALVWEVGNSARRLWVLIARWKRKRDQP